jgi:hypothetical protein
VSRQSFVRFRRFSRLASPALATVVAVASFALRAPEAQGADDKSACVASYDRSQVLRRDHRLQRAREELRGCSRAACPALVRNDCLTWLEQVQAELPSLTIRAAKDGADIANVTIVEDDVVVATRLDGSSLEVDPGEHAFRFETEGAPPVALHLVVREREKDRVVPINFVWPGSVHSPADAAIASPAVATARPIPLGAFVLGGVAVAGLATFGVLGIVGKNAQSSLQDTCAPNCAQNEISKVRSEYIGADVALGVGVAALVSAGIWFVLRPNQAEPPADVESGLSVTPTHGGAIPTWRGAF